MLLNAQQDSSTGNDVFVHFYIALRSIFTGVFCKSDVTNLADTEDHILDQQQHQNTSTERQNKCLRLTAPKLAVDHPFVSWLRYTAAK